MLSPAFLNKHMEWGMSFGDVKDKIPEQGSMSTGDRGRIAALLSTCASALRFEILV